MSKSTGVTFATFAALFWFVNNALGWNIQRLCPDQGWESGPGSPLAK